MSALLAEVMISGASGPADLPLPFPLKRQQGIRVRLDKRLRPAEAPHHAYECDGAASSLCASIRCGGRCTDQQLLLLLL